MNTSSLTRIVGWSAYISAVATILTLLTGILFFTIGQPFGSIEDFVSVLQVVFMIPIAIGLYRLSLSAPNSVSLFAAVVGIVGMLIAAVGQGLLVLNLIDYPTSMKFFPGAVTIGIWLLVVCYLARANGYFPHGLVWAGFVAGAGYLVTVAGFLWGGQESPVFYLGSLALGIVYPVWAIWLGWLLLSLGMR
jgi:hypothetical protein